MNCLRLYDIGKRSYINKTIHLLEIHSLFSSEYFSGAIPLNEEWGPAVIN